MRVGKFLMATAAAVMVASPAVAATANPAAKLSLSKSVRAGTPTAKKSQDQASSGIIIGVLAAAAVIAGIIVATDGDDDADSN